jgi:hypothetical protein
MKTMEIEFVPRPVGVPAVAVPPTGQKMAVDREFFFSHPK